MIAHRRRAQRHGRHQNAGMPIELLPAHQVSPSRLHAAFQQAFADYLTGPFDLPADRWPHFLRRQGADLSLSRAAFAGDQLMAFALVAPRAGGTRWRLATMGAVPAARGLGAAPALLDDLIDRALAQGVRRLELEVFAQNERAVRLYRSRGFEILHPLHGYEAAGASAAAPSDPEAGVELDRESAWAWLDEAEHHIGDLPLQVTPAVLSALPDGTIARRLGTAQMVSGANAAGAVVVHSLIDRDPGQRDAEALARDLVRRLPRRVVVVPPLQRPDLGGDALRRAGFTVQPLHQWLMARDVPSVDRPAASV